MVTKTSLRRLSLMAGIGLAAWGCLCLRLIDLQINQREAYMRQAEEQQHRALTIPASRGLIFDRHLRPMALNIGVDSYSVQGMPDGMRTDVSDDHFRRFAAQFATLTHQSPDRLFVKLSDTSSFHWLARGIDRKTSARLQQLVAMEALDSRIRIHREVQRVYPYGPVAGQLIGFTDVDGRGLTGIERAFNQILSGAQGFSLVQVDGTGQPYSRIDGASRPPVDGAHVILTLDAATQYAAEVTLQETIAHHQARGGQIVVLDPDTGEILAMASEPSFNPNQPGASPMETQKIRPVVDMYEPGSTFKLVAATAALDTRTVGVNDLIDCGEGVISIGGQRITDHEAFGLLTFQEVIAHSSNVGTIKVAQELGERTFYRYTRDFGFGSTTGIELPGEARGVLPPPSAWSGTTLSTMAIGYGVSVTGLQLALAYGAAANGGYLMEPRLVKAIVHADGAVEQRKPRVVRQVMRPETANTLRHILKAVVERGTGVKAAINGYQVAGKTGTAWKTREDGPGYTRNYRSSFIGFFPADDPEVVALVLIDEPTKQTGFYGGDVAAPAFKTLMKRLLGQPQGPVTTPSQGEDGVPRYLAALREMAPSTPPLEMLSAPGEDRAKPLPHTDPEFGPGAAARPAPAGPAVQLPSVIGLSLREAFNRLSKEGVKVTVVGSGRVVRQTPEPGTVILSGDPCTIECRPVDTVAFVPSD